jgi:NAD(P)-dependent dehydrogenase (short-subunit alcohol dehydrogenase family)
MAATIGGRPGRSAYVALKAAVAFTVGFAKEVARQGIRVNALRPGMTDAVRQASELRAQIAATIAIYRCAEP